MAKKSTRTRSLEKIKQATTHLETSAQLYDSAMQPYFDRFPEKKTAHDAVIACMSTILDTMEASLADM